ncbi:hypothetical protein DID88_007543 [Monilinia fructigena]|uniref:Uncharacterized protein n=1 Tax=Monilinia fructigena TaxID=38457 RepID=A0A395J2P8_9HELO|nr:hypothetical protein DID88_007543 [Monilinia fructigena]
MRVVDLDSFVNVEADFEEEDEVIDVEDRGDEEENTKVLKLDPLLHKPVLIPVAGPVATEELKLLLNSTLVLATLLTIGVAVQIPVELAPSDGAPEGGPEIDDGKEVVDKGVVVQLAGKGIVVQVPDSTTVIHCVLVQLSVIVMMLVGFAEQRVRDVDWFRMRVAWRGVEDGVEAEMAFMTELEMGGERGTGAGVEVKDEDEDVLMVMDIGDKTGSVTVETPVEELERLELIEIECKRYDAVETAIEELESKVAATRLLDLVSSGLKCGCV